MKERDGDSCSLFGWREMWGGRSDWSPWCYEETSRSWWAWSLWWWLQPPSPLDRARGLTESHMQVAFTLTRSQPMGGFGAMRFGVTALWRRCPSPSSKLNLQESRGRHKRLFTWCMKRLAKPEFWPFVQEVARVRQSGELFVACKTQHVFTSGAAQYRRQSTQAYCAYGKMILCLMWFR